MKAVSNVKPKRSREVVTTAPALLTSRYLFEAEEQGDFWKGRALITMGGEVIRGGVQFSCEAIGRTPERAIAFALRKAADVILDFEDFKPW